MTAPFGQCLSLFPLPPHSGNPGVAGNRSWLRMMRSLALNRPCPIHCILLWCHGECNLKENSRGFLGSAIWNPEMKVGGQTETDWYSQNLQESVKLRCLYWIFCPDFLMFTKAECKRELFCTPINASWPSSPTHCVSGSLSLGYVLQQGWPLDLL